MVFSPIEAQDRIQRCFYFSHKCTKSLHYVTSVDLWSDIISQRFPLASTQAQPTGGFRNKHKRESMLPFTSQVIHMSRQTKNGGGSRDVKKGRWQRHCHVTRGPCRRLLVGNDGGHQGQPARS